MADADNSDAPNDVHNQDLRALIGVLAIIEGHIRAREIPEHLTEQLQRRFISVGLLNESSRRRDLRQAINDLNHRLRYARGEYPEPPDPFPVPD
jgi:hypothetical protein